MSGSGVLAATLWRGELIENSHIVHVAVVDESGTVLFHLGAARRTTLIRSAAKPAQAVVMVDSGALERFGCDEADLALMCASHSSQADHVERASRMLERLALHESDLRCGGHSPLSEQVQRDWMRTGFVPGPLCSNCSGKHVGMLAAALSLGYPVLDYHLPEHPLQVRVRRCVANFFSLPEHDVAWAIDGCNLPTPAIPLAHLAQGYARLAGSLPGTTLARIYRAMTRHPHLVAGEGRFCTALMQAFDGALVGKVGADASYAIGVQASPRTAALGALGALGISVKVEDGNLMVLHAVVCELLAQLDVGTPTQRERLAAFHAPVQYNTAGIRTGHLALQVSLQR